MADKSKIYGHVYFRRQRVQQYVSADYSKKTFDAVQERLAKNRYTLGGKETARVPYLHTGKLFCGHCGTEMVADGGTSKTGAQHHYYICKKRRSGKCDKNVNTKIILNYTLLLA